MGSKKLALRVLTVGCMPLSRDVLAAVEELAHVVGAVNLHPELSIGKCNYDVLAEFADRRPQDIFWTRDINDSKTRDWMAGREP